MWRGWHHCCVCSVASPCAGASNRVAVDVSQHRSRAQAPLARIDCAPCTRVVASGLLLRCVLCAAATPVCAVVPRRRCTSRGSARLIIVTVHVDYLNGYQTIALQPIESTAAAHGCHSKVPRARHKRRSAADHHWHPRTPPCEVRVGQRVCGSALSCVTRWSSIEAASAMATAGTQQGRVADYRDRSQVSVLTQAQKDEARVAALRERKEARRDRFLDARTRTIGVDVDALAAQIKEKQEAKAREAEEDLRYGECRAAERHVRRRVGRAGRRGHCPTGWACIRKWQTCRVWRAAVGVACCWSVTMRGARRREPGGQAGSAEHPPPFERPSQVCRQRYAARPGPLFTAATLDALRRRAARYAHA